MAGCIFHLTSSKVVVFHKKGTVKGTVKAVYPNEINSFFYAISFKFNEKVFSNDILLP